MTMISPKTVETSNKENFIDAKRFSLTIKISVIKCFDKRKSTVEYFLTVTIVKITE